jgi:hypothetical protein
MSGVAGAVAGIGELFRAGDDEPDGGQRSVGPPQPI